MPHLSLGAIPRSHIELNFGMNLKDNLHRVRLRLGTHPGTQLGTHLGAHREPRSKLNTNPTSEHAEHASNKTTNLLSHYKNTGIT